MKKIPNLVILILIFMSLHAKKIQETEIYELKEAFNNSKFELYQEIRDGSIKTAYKVDGKPVSKPEYDSLIAEAKKIDWVSKRSKKEQLHALKGRKKIETKLKISKKIYNKELNSLKELINKLKSSQLENYYAFCPDTFANENEISRLINSAIPELDGLLKRSDTELDTNLINNISEKLKIYNQKLRLFIQNSVDNAINKCDDTKKLKQLMNFIDEV